MDIKQAKKICPEFRPIRSEGGKKKCRFITDGLCKRPEYFRCELLLHKEKNDTLAIALPSTTVAQVDAAQRCPRLYALNYIYRVEPPIKPVWKLVGTAFNDCRAKIDAGLPWKLDGDIKSYPLDVVKLRCILKAYEKHRNNKGLKLMSEVRVQFAYKDIAFVGYINSITTDRRTIYEWKYAAQHYDELKAIRQAVIYLKAEPNAKRFILAVAKKPTHKPKKAPKPTKKVPDPRAETMLEYEKRVMAAVDTEDTFTYMTFDREFFDIDATLEQLYQAKQISIHQESAGWPPAFGRNCENCDFRPYCLRHLTQIGCGHKLCSHSRICDVIRTKELPKGPPDPKKLTK